MKIEYVYVDIHVNHLVGEEPRSPIDCDSLLVKQIEQNAQRINIPQVKAIWIIWDRCPFDGSKPSESVRKCWYTVYPKLKSWFLNVKFAQFIIAKKSCDSCTISFDKDLCKLWLWVKTLVP